MASPIGRYFVVTGTEPLVAKDTVSGVTYYAADENFDLSGYAAFYHANVGLEEGDMLMVHPVDAGDGEPTWVATSVTTDNDHPAV